MPERTCEKCGSPLVPVKVAEVLTTTQAILYADGLWAIDGMATLKPAWACRKACGDPVPVVEGADNVEWAMALGVAIIDCKDRLWRSGQKEAISKEAPASANATQTEAVIRCSINGPLDSVPDECSHAPDAAPGEEPDCDACEHNAPVGLAWEDAARVWIQRCDAAGDES